MKITLPSLDWLIAVCDSRAVGASRHPRELPNRCSTQSNRHVRRPPRSLSSSASLSLRSTRDSAGRSPDRECLGDAFGFCVSCLPVVSSPDRVEQVALRRAVLDPGAAEDRVRANADDRRAREERKFRALVVSTADQRDPRDVKRHTLWADDRCDPPIAGRGNHAVGSIALTTID
jgi:hypothetical protein